MEKMKELIKKYKKYTQKVLILIFGIVFLGISRELLGMHLSGGVTNDIHVSMNYLTRLTIVSWFLVFLVGIFLWKVKLLQDTSKKVRELIQILLVLTVSFLVVLFFYNETVFFYLPIIYPTFFHLKVFWWDIMNVVVVTYIMYRVFGNLILYIVGAIFFGLVFGTFAFFNSEIAIPEWISVVGYFVVVIWYSIRVWKKGDRNTLYQMSFFLIAGMVFGNVYLLNSYEGNVCPYVILSILPYLFLQIYNLIQKKKV